MLCALRKQASTLLFFPYTIKKNGSRLPRHHQNRLETSSTPFTTRGHATICAWLEPKWLEHLKRQIFASGSFVVCVWKKAVIKMIIKGRSRTMRHVSRTHRVALDWLFDRINLDPKIQIKYIDTKNQLADILTKVNFTRDEWNHLFCLFKISHFRSAECSEVMTKRTQKESGEERVTAKSKPMMNLVSRCSERTPDVLASTYSEWNVDKTRSSQEWKSYELMEVKTGRPFFRAAH